MNRVTVAANILKIESHLSLTRAAMILDDMEGYVLHLNHVNILIRGLTNSTMNSDQTRALVTK